MIMNDHIQSSAQINEILPAPDGPQEAKKPKILTKGDPIGDILLNYPIFNSPIFDRLKKSKEIFNTDDLLNNFCEDKEACKELLRAVLNKVRGQKPKTTAVKDFDYTKKLIKKSTNLMDGQISNSNVKISNKNLLANQIADNKFSKVTATKKLQRSAWKPMKAEELGSFIHGVLPPNSTHNEEYKHKILYFKFPNKGKRTIAQLKGFLKSCDLKSTDFSWIDMIEDKVLEITCRAKDMERIVTAVGAHLKFLEKYQPENLMSSDPEEREGVKIPEQKSTFVERSKRTILYLEKMGTRRNYRNFLTKLCKRIQEEDTLNEAVMDIDKDIEVEQLEKAKKAKTSSGNHSTDKTEASTKC